MCENNSTSEETKWTYSRVRVQDLDNYKRNIEIEEARIDAKREELKKYEEQILALETATAKDRLRECLIFSELIKTFRMERNDAYISGLARIISRDGGESL